MTTTRREWLMGYLAVSLFPTLARAGDQATTRFRLICAPSNLGLRPNASGAIPGTWRAPEGLLAAGIARALGVARIDQVDRIVYETHEQSGTRIRNGHGIRAFSLTLAEK